MMIISIKGVLGGRDLSANLERTGFEIEATFGNRMDILKCQLFDPGLQLAIPDRAEIVIYDTPAGGAVVDPPTAISAYNTFTNGSGSEVTSANPALWTPRLFAGYSAAPVYSLDGGQRIIQLQAQDYTTRLRSTVVNRAYGSGQTDQFIVQDIFKTYRPDFDTSNVQSTVSAMPAISFPVHTLEQFMQRVTKVSRAVYRVDYYKRLFYGPIGQLTAPFNLSDQPTNPIGFISPGFEADNSAWQGLGGVGTGLATIDSTNPHTGTYALKMTNPGSGNYGTSFNKYGIPVTGLTNLTVAAWFKGSAAGTIGPLRITFANPGSLINSNGVASAQPSAQAGVSITDFNPTITTSYAQYSETIAVPGGYAWAFIEIYSNGTGAVATTYVDDITIIAVPTTFGYEQAQYSPDVTGLSDKVWVVGHSFLSGQQTYTVPVALVNGSTYQFPLPGSATKGDITQIQVNGVNQTFGQAPGDGDITSQSSFKFQALVQPTPAILAFASTPPNAATVTITGKFRYPLIQSYSDPVLVAQAGGLIFEAVVRDKRIRDLTLAQQVAKAYLASQGLSMKGFQCLSMARSLGSALIQPGQVINVTGAIMFSGLGGPTLQFLITRVRLTLDQDSDLDHPYRVEVEMVDRPITAGGY